MIGDRMMGISLAATRDVVEGRAHFDRAITLYEPDAHRPLATRFSIDSRVSTLGFRSVALWFLGYPEAALVDSEHALKDAREIRPGRCFDVHSELGMSYRNLMRKLRASRRACR